MSYGDTPEQIAANHEEYRKWLRLAIKIAVGVLGLVLVIIFAFKAINPQLNLYRSNTEKKAVIAEQQAISEAEVYAAEKRVIAAGAEADARRIEAQGIADAQEIIAATLTPEYLTWRYYEVLATTKDHVVYVPTEAGLPILEATRPTGGE